MNRRTFLKWLGISSAAAVVPKVVEDEYVVGCDPAVDEDSTSCWPYGEVAAHPQRAAEWLAKNEFYVHPDVLLRGPECEVPSYLEYEEAPFTIKVTRS